MEIPPMPYAVFERILRHIPGDVSYATIGVTRFDNSDVKSQLEAIVGSQRLGEVTVDTLTLREPPVEAVLAIYQSQFERSRFPPSVSAEKAAKITTPSRVHLDEVLLRTPHEHISITPTSVKVNLDTLAIPEYVHQLREIAQISGSGVIIEVSHRSAGVFSPYHNQLMG